MKKIFILQNSFIRFGLESEKIYQPEKYSLYLVINKFGSETALKPQQSKFYTKVIVTDDFSLENIILLIKSYIDKDDEFDVVTNSEETMPICGQIRVNLNLDSEDYSRFYNKDIMKEKLIGNDGLLIPKYKVFEPEKYQSRGEKYINEIVENLSFPLFVKPIQMYSSINVKKIIHIEELIQWAKSIKSNDYYEIDEFIEGTMYHCDSYIKNGQILFTFVSQNSRPCYDFTIGYMKGTIVLPEKHPDAIKLSIATQKALKKLGLPKAGVTHLELIRTKEDKLYFIEVAHRSPGCLIPRMYQTHAGVDTIASHFLLQIDADYVPTRGNNAYAAWACYPKTPGRVSEIKEPSKKLRCNYDIEWHVKIGDEITEFSQFGRDYTGTIFMVSPDFDTLYQDFYLVDQENLCVIK